jgi:uncharacterized membrane protein
MALIAQIALGVIIGGLTIALLVTGFFVWNSRQRNERLAVALFIAGAVIVVALLLLLLWRLVTRKARWLSQGGSKEVVG